MQQRGISLQTVDSAQSVIQRLIEDSIIASKTKIEKATVLLVGGGSFILPDRVEGTDTIVRPPFYQVANAVGAAVSYPFAIRYLETQFGNLNSTATQIGKISSTFDRFIIPGDRSVRDIVADGKRRAIAMCERAGGDPSDVEIVDLEAIPEPYAMDGTFRLVVRAVSSIKDVAALGRCHTKTEDTDHDQEPSFTNSKYLHESISNYADSREQYDQLDLDGYRPDVKNGIWTVSETDVELLIAGTGVLGVGCIGEATNYLLSLKSCLREGRKIRIISCSSVGADAVICPPLFIVSTHSNLFFS